MLRKQRTTRSRSVRPVAEPWSERPAAKLQEQETLGASNIKWSEWLPQNFVFHEAHVEAVERGLHLITIANQPRCEVHEVYLDGDLLPETGPQAVAVRIRNTKKETTVFIDVDCH